MYPNKYSILEFFLTTNIELCMKGDQGSTCNLQSCNRAIEIYICIKFGIYYMHYI